MAAKNMARVYISITTLDHELARTLEPRAAAPPRRLQTVRALSDAGVPVGVMVAPVIPQLNDRDLEAILEAAAQPARATPAGSCCACRWKSRRCSATGSMRTIRCAPTTS